MKSAVAIVFCVALAVSAGAEMPVLDWAAQHAGTSGRSIGLDADGNVYMAGPILVKYDAAGDELWAVSLGGYAYHMAVDAAGNTVAGFQGVATSYDADGDFRWSASFNGEPGGVTYLPDGNAAVTGTTMSEQIHTAVYDTTDGSLLWSHTPSTGYALDDGNAIAADASGNVTVAGRVCTRTLLDVCVRSDIYVIRYTATGALSWVRQFGDSSVTEAGYAVAADAGGNAYVAGQVETDPSETIVLKYGADGDLLWERRIAEGQENFPRTIMAAPGGGAIVAGSAYDDATSHDYLVTRFDAAGSVDWSLRYNGPAGYYDTGEGLALDAAGNAFVTGWSNGVDSGHDILTLKIGAAGDIVWAARYFETATTGEFGLAAVADGAGGVYVAGEGYIKSWTLHYATCEDCGCHIGEVPREDGAMNPVNDCEVCDIAAATDDWAVLPDGTECTDGLFCTGDDFCLAGFCGDHDGDPCPPLFCNEETDECTADEYCVDADYDGFFGQTPSCPSGTDCDDTTGFVAPDRDEFCNGYDDNCDGRIDENPGFLCGNTEFCDGDEYCDGANGCQSTGSPCEDGETCNEDEDICESPGIGCGVSGSAHRNIAPLIVIVVVAIGVASRRRRKR